MGVIIDTNWRLYNTELETDQVGWPAPTNADPSTVYQRLSAMCAEFKAAGFTAVGLPPSTKGAAGESSDGYDLLDPYDIGTKNQLYSTPTAFGTGEQLRQLISVAHANGMDVYSDVVLHQYDGMPGGVYQTLGANGVKNAGRFPKHPSCFAISPTIPGGVTADPVPDSQGNYAFGDMASYVNSTPKDYMKNGAIAAVQWLVRTTGIDGFRIDDTKGTNAGFIYSLVTAKYINNMFVFGEYFDGNPNALWAWVNDDMGRRSATLDFMFKFNAGNICNNNSRVWMGQCANLGYCNIDALMAVTFCESADTDTSIGEQMIWNKALGYALMLTFPGYPRVYYRDWSTDANCYGLKPIINNLIWIHENLAGGDFVVRLDSHPQVFVHERLGYGNQIGCVCFFNNDQYNEYTITVQTSLGAYAEVHEYTGNGNYNNIWTDQYGNLTANVPRNNNGHSYLVYARPTGTTIPAPIVKETTQVFFGAADLDLPPLSIGVNPVATIYCAANTEIYTSLSSAVQGTVSIFGPDGGVLKTPFWTNKSGPHNVYVLVSVITVTDADYSLSITYTGMETP